MKKVDPGLAGRYIGALAHGTWLFPGVIGLAVPGGEFIELVFPGENEDKPTYMPIKPFYLRCRIAK